MLALNVVPIVPVTLLLLLTKALPLDVMFRLTASTTTSDPEPPIAVVEPEPRLIVFAVIVPAVRDIEPAVFAKVTVELAAFIGPARMIEPPAVTVIEVAAETPG